MQFTPQCQGIQQEILSPGGNLDETRKTKKGSENINIAKPSGKTLGKKWIGYIQVETLYKLQFE